MNTARSRLIEPLYKVESPRSSASQTMGQAAGTFGRMQAGSTTTTEAPGKTAGGGMMAGMGGAAGGAMVGAEMGAAGGPWGAAAGACIGAAAYYLS